MSDIQTNEIDPDLEAALRRAFEERGATSGEGVPAASPPPPAQTEEGEPTLADLPGFDPEIVPDDGSTANGQPQPQVDGQGQGEGEGEGELDPTASPLVEPPITAQGVDLNAIARQVYGDVPITQEQALALFQIQQDLQSLTPEQREELGRVLYGTPQPQPQGQPQPSQPSPAPVASPGGYDYSPDPMLAEIEEDYPEIARALRAQQELTQRQLADLASWRDSYEREQYQQRQEAYNRGASAGMQAWRQAHPEFTEEELVAIAVRSGAGNYAGILVQQGYTPEQAVMTALDTAVMTDPTYRQKVIDAEVARREQEINQNLSKKQKAAAITGGGGPPSRELPVPNLTDPDARRAAMREVINSARTEDITSPPAG